MFTWPFKDGKKGGRDCVVSMIAAASTPLTPPPYEPPVPSQAAAAPYTLPTPQEGRARRGRVAQATKSTIVGCVFVGIIWFVFGLASAVLSLPTLMAVFLSGFTGTLLSGALTACSGRMAESAQVEHRGLTSNCRAAFSKH
jgi:hypothetical protein